MPVIPINRIPLRDSQVNLDISGVAGFFGGDIAVSAMGTVCLYKGRKWCGWYNSPGSYEIAKRYGRLAQHRIWCGLYPGATDDPTVLFELDGKVGPRYRAVHSGTSMDQTYHLAYLLCQECKKRPTQVWEGEQDARRTIPIDVSIAYLHRVPLQEFPQDTLVSVTTWLSFLPILASAAACISCGLVADWYCCCMIAFGMFCSGVSCLVIGRGKVTFAYPEPSAGAPVGDGYLMDGLNEQVVILRGAEGAVNPITRGRFSLEYNTQRFHVIGLSSMLLTVQFLLQLLMVPQGTIIGQIMFLSSLAVSWMYNSYLSSLDKESIQRRILVDKILGSPTLHKFRLGTRTTTAVFVMLVLSSSQTMDAHSLRKLLDDILGNDTKVWRHWKDNVVEEVCLRFEKGKEPVFKLPSDETGFTTEEAKLLENLYHDARSAYQAFETYNSVEAKKPSGIDRGSKKGDCNSSSDDAEKGQSDQGVDRIPEGNVETRTSTLGYYSNLGTDETGNGSRPVSVSGWSRTSSCETRVDGVDGNWHGTCNPTETNWHGSCGTGPQ